MEGRQKLKRKEALGEEFKYYISSEIHKEIIRIENLLQDYRNWFANSEYVKVTKSLKVHHIKLLKSEEIVWRQRSRVMWLNARDRNTNIFQGKVAQRNKTNNIKRLGDSNGV